MADNDPDQENVEYAYKRLRQAQRRLKRHQEEFDPDEKIPEGTRKRIQYEDIDGIIMDCQYCIEISVKSMHKIIGRKYQTKAHGLEFGNGDTQEFVKNVPEDFVHENKIPRAIFLTQFWDTFYELSKYGAPNVDKDPEDIFHWRDAERAVEDATFCLNLAFHLLDYTVDTYDIDDPRPDPSNLELNLTIDPYSLDYEQK